MKKNILIITAICFLLLIGNVSAITGSIGNAKMILYPEVDGVTTTVIEKSILVKNTNNIPINITLQIGEGEEFLELINQSFNLAPGENKKAEFKVKVSKIGTYNGRINILFESFEGNEPSVTMSSIIIVHAKKGENYEGIGDKKADIAYVVKNSQDNFLINEIRASGLTYEVIYESDVLSTNFSEYRMILVGNDNFNNPNDIPVSEYKSLITNSYHYYKKGILFPDYQWGWSKKKGFQTSPSSIKINDFNISITSNTSEFLSAYTVKDPNVQTDYLRSKKPAGIRLIAYVYGSAHTNGDSVIAVVNPGVEFLNGNIAKERSLFFGVTEPRYWTPETKQLFENSISWILIGEDRDKDSFFTDTDCNDDDSGINPDSTEIAYDGIDQNCDGSDLTDVDEDGFDTEIVGGDDCNDDDPEISPNSTDLIKNCRNDAPIIKSIPRSTYRETLLVEIPISASDPDPGEVNLTYSANDTRFNVSGNTLTWQTGYEDAGDYVFTAFVSDGDLTASKEFILKIKENNRAPVFNTTIPDLNWSEDTNVTLNLSSYFFDEDKNDSLTFSLSNTSSDTHIILRSLINGTANFYADKDWNGTDWIVFRASDGKSSTDTNKIILNVLPVNDAPVLETQIPNQEWKEDNSITINLSDYFKDVDSNLDYSYYGNSLISINISGSSASIVPGKDWNGNDSVIFEASDGQYNATSSPITLTVLAVNDAPVLEHIEGINVFAGKSAEIIPIASDVDNDSLTFNFNSPLDTLGKWQTTENDIGNYKTLVSVIDGNGKNDYQEVNIFVFQKILINEILPDPLNNGKEWIELYNPHSQNIDLSNCNIKDGENALIELEGTIGKDKYFSVEMNNELRDSGDLVRLYCFNELVDSVAYGDFNDGDILDNALNPNKGDSIGRNPNGKDTDNDLVDFRVFIAPTKELPNDADVTPPAIELLSPNDNELFSDTRDIDFNFKVSDDMAGTLECGIYLNNILRGATNAVNAEISEFRVNNLDDGAYSWNVKCSDGFNDNFAAQNRNFDISAPDNPILNSIGNRVISENKTLEFVVSATDSDDGNALKLSAQLINGNSLSTIGANFVDNSNGTGTFLWTPTYKQSGDYDIKFLVEDETGLKDSEEIKITVTNVRKPPVFSDIERCESVNKDLKIIIKNPDEGDGFEPGEEVKVDLEIENNYIDELDVDVEVFLYDVNDEDVIESVDDNLDVKSEESKDLDFIIEIPENIENERLAVFVIAKGKNDVVLCNEEYVEIEVERDDDNVIISSIEITPKKTGLGSSVDLEIKVENIGDDEQERVYVLVENTELEISEKSEEFDIEEFGKDDKKKLYFSAEIPEDAEGKEYDLMVTVFFGNKKNSNKETLTVIGKLNIRDIKLTESLSESGVILLRAGDKSGYNAKSENPDKEIMELSDSEAEEEISDSDFKFRTLIVILLVILLVVIVFFVNIFRLEDLFS